MSANIYRDIALATIGIGVILYIAFKLTRDWVREVRARRERKLPPALR